MFADSPAPHVAVVGGGVFGCAVAWRLAEAGLSVSLFERSAELLTGATLNNHNRIHQGFHYPRDRATAKQCQAGFSRFCETFAEAISVSWPNLYAVAASNSLTRAADYLEFCRDVGLQHEVIDLARYGTEIRGCELAIASGEAIYDCGTLRRLLRTRLEMCNVEIHCDSEVNSLRTRRCRFELELSVGTRVAADIVINCCYADSNRLSRQIGVPVRMYQYEYTVVPVVELDIARQAITIMDGPFGALVPFGHSNRFLLYHVSYSVLRKEIMRELDPDWRNAGCSPVSGLSPLVVFARIRDAIAKFVPAVESARLVELLHGPRVVLAYREKQDARPSLVQSPRPGYWEVFSGKVDHCLGIADKVRDQISHGLHHQRAK